METVNIALHSTFFGSHSTFCEMALPHKIATLLYCFNEYDEVLLLERTKEPNLGLWSPCGGKLHTDAGESPYNCACREAYEEIRLRLDPFDLRLTGIVSEHGYAGQAHWLMFLFEVRRRLTLLPPPHPEGHFQFFPAAAVAALKLPETDREQIWPLFWRHRGGFFAAHCRSNPHGHNEWAIEESRIATKLVCPPSTGANPFPQDALLIPPLGFNV